MAKFGSRNHANISRSSSIKGGRGVLARLVFPAPRKNCRTPTVYCIGKNNKKNFISLNSVLPRVFLYPVSCPE